MDFFVSIDADGAGQLVGRASLANDVEGLRRMSQNIDLGNKIWTDWALDCGGSVVSAGGDEARLIVPGHRISQLPSVVKRYYDATGFTVTVGIGVKISEADKALLVGKIRGKNRVEFYDESMENELAAITKQSEQDKIAEHYLNKADPDQEGRLSTGLPIQTAPPDDNLDQAGQVLEEIVDAQSHQPPPAEATPAAKDFERLFHNHATLQQEKDNEPIKAKNSQLDELRAQVASVLESVKEQVPVLDELQEVAPDTYEAVINLTQAVIELARELKDQDLEKSEALIKAFETVMPLPKPRTKKRASIPVGTTLNNKIKVKHPDGSTSWANVKNGQILSAEGNPVSARYPDKGKVV